MNISRNTTIEDIVESSPSAVRYLREQGIKCIACGEPVWGTLEEAAREKGFEDAQIDLFVKEINKFA